MASTSQGRSTPAFGQSALRLWQAAGLLQPSVVKPVLATLEQRLMRETLGCITETDRTAFEAAQRILLRCLRGTT